MKDFSVKFILIAIVVLNILDGDFANMGVLDLVKFALLAICLVLTFLPSKKEGE